MNIAGRQHHSNIYTKIKFRTFAVEHFSILTLWRTDVIHKYHLLWHQEALGFPTELICGLNVIVRTKPLYYCAALTGRFLYNAKEVSNRRGRKRILVLLFGWTGWLTETVFAYLCGWCVHFGPKLKTTVAGYNCKKPDSIQGWFKDET